MVYKIREAVDLYRARTRRESGVGVEGPGTALQRKMYNSVHARVDACSGSVGRVSDVSWSAGAYGRLLCKYEQEMIGPVDSRMSVAFLWLTW